MKTVWCIFLLSAALVAGKPNQKTFQIPQELIPPIIQASADCADKFGLETIELLPKFFSGDLENTDSVRKYIYCLGVKSGYANEEGNIVKAQIAKVFGPDQSPKIEAVVDECNKIKYNDKYEAVYQVVACFRDKSGLVFKL